MKNQARRIGEWSEVAHIGVKRLGPGEDQHDRTHREERRAGALDEEREGVAGREPHRPRVGDDIPAGRRDPAR